MRFAVARPAHEARARVLGALVRGRDADVREPAAKRAAVESDHVLATSSVPLEPSADDATVREEWLDQTPPPQSPQWDEDANAALNAVLTHHAAPERHGGDGYFAARPHLACYATKREANDDIARELRHGGGGRFVPLWACQESGSGAQSFIVGGYRAFWSHYAALAPAQRVHYEMIQSDALVKPFADFDATTDAMNSAEFFARVDVLSRIVVELLERDYGLPRARVTRLDSCAGAKLSCHCVWTLPGAMFRSVAHVKAFMAGVGLEAARRWPSWTAESDTRVFGILDMAVYKAGAYRLYGSTKLGQQRPLRVPGEVPHAALSEGVFFASLVQHFDRGTTLARVLECAVRPDAQLPAVRALAGGLVSVRLSPPATVDDYRRSAEGINSLPLTLLARIVVPVAAAACVCRRWYQAVHGHWPLRARDAVLEAAVRHAIGDAHPDGALDGGRYYEGWYGRCLVFNQRSRQCELNAQLKGRAHLHNTVYWVALVDVGVYYQRCHDVDCKAVTLPGLCAGRGVERALPAHALYCHRSSNVGSGAALMVRRLVDNRETLLRPGDVVHLAGDGAVRYAVRAVDCIARTADLERLDRPAALWLVSDEDLGRLDLAVGESAHTLVMVKEEKGPHPPRLDSVVMVKEEKGPHPPRPDSVVMVKEEPAPHPPRPVSVVMVKEEPAPHPPRPDSVVKEENGPSSPSPHPPSPHQPLRARLRVSTLRRSRK